MPRIATLLCTTTALAVTALGSVAAGAAPPAEETPELPALRVSVPPVISLSLDPDAPRLETTDARELPGTDQAGPLARELAALTDAARADEAYAGEWYEPAAGRLRLFLTGRPAGDLAAVVDRAEQVRVEIESAPYGRDRIVAAASELVRGGLAATARPAVDGTGIVASWSVADPKAPTPAPELRTVAGVPVLWEEPAEGNGVEPFDSRDADAGPFAGGSRMWFAVGSSNQNCSTGFSVTRDDNGAAGTLTALHCVNGSTGNLFWTLADIVGTSRSLASLKWDAQFVRDDGSSYQGKVWAGGTATTSQRSVVSYVAVPMGSVLSSSGGMSGSRNGQYFADTTINQSPIGDPAMEASYPTLWNPNDAALAGGGDSGSAVIQTHSEERASPFGLISGGPKITSSWVRPCAGVPTGTGRYCTAIVYVTPWVQVRNALDVTVRTSASL